MLRRRILLYIHLSGGWHEVVFCTPWPGAQDPVVNLSIIGRSFDLSMAGRLGFLTPRVSKPCCGAFYHGCRLSLGRGSRGIARVARGPRKNRRLTQKCYFAVKAQRSTSRLSRDPTVFCCSPCVFHDCCCRPSAIVIFVSPRTNLPLFFCPSFDTYRLIPEGAVDPKYIEESMDTPDTGSFMHLHLGIDGKGLDDLDIHYSVRREEGNVWGDFS